MARLKKGGVPAYHHHKARNSAVVTLDGIDHYLGPFASPSSKQKYAALIRAWQERESQPDVPQGERPQPNDQPSVNELILAYLKHDA